jgi:Pentapeptide repeats (9 copies)
VSINISLTIRKWILAVDKKLGAGSKKCIFHDEKYVKDHYVEYEREAIQRFEKKVTDSSSENKPLECIGYFIPPVEFAKYFSTTTLTEKGFSQPVHFNKATFYGATNFSGATFSDQADFAGATFSNEADFTEAKFSSNKGETLFKYIILEQPNKVTFSKNNLSKVSFVGSDITRIRFGDKISWGGRDEFTIIDEEWLKEQVKREQKGKIEQASLEDVLSVYRNLRENYEFRLRYDDAGKLFIKEMELKRKYKTVRSKNGKNSEVKKNGWFRRNLSLTGFYYNLFVYGEDLKRPALTLLLPLFIVSTVYWGGINTSSPSFSNDGFALWLNATARTAFDMSQVERKSPELMDSAIKTATLAILGTLIIPLRRKFERKYTR